MPPDCACPLCGQPIAEMPLTVLVERGMVVGEGRFVVLTTHETMLLQKLVDDFPRVVTKEALMMWLYSLRIDREPEIKIIDVWICKLRKKLKPLGVRIDTSWGHGYALGVSAKPRIVAEAA